MQLFTLDLNPDGSETSLKLGAEIKPEKFQNISLGKNSKGKDQKSKESDMESLIVDNPKLLNYDESDFESTDLLIISRQLTSKTNKRSDLVALDKDGYLITIEIKRDAQDEKNRAECMEFQSIRYAANHRTLDKDRVINIYADYLQKLRVQKGEEAKPEECRALAINNICQHLSDDDEDVTEDSLSKYIEPSERQKIFLVAADFAPDCLAACAWLREHHIDIYCFKLQPYKINDAWFLHQERLIPPVALDEFYIGTKEAKEKEKQERGTRAASIRPVRLYWGGEEITCKTWHDALVSCVKKAVSVELDISSIQGLSDKKDYRTPEIIKTSESRTLTIETHASRDQIEKWISSIVSELKKQKKENSSFSIAIELKDGTTETIGE